MVPQTGQEQQPEPCPFEWAAANKERSWREVGTAFGPRNAAFGALQGVNMCWDASMNVWSRAIQMPAGKCRMLEDERELRGMSGFPLLSLAVSRWQCEC